MTGSPAASRRRRFDPLDLAAAAVVAAVALVLLPLLAVALRLTRGVWRRPGRRIIYLGTGQIAQVFPRNGVNLFLERECSDFGGYFTELWNIHFPAGTRGSLDLTPRHHLVDFDLPLPPALARLRLTAVVLREAAFLAWLLVFVWRRDAAILTATNPYLQGLNAALAGAALGLPFAVIVTRDYDWDWRYLGKQAFPTLFPSRRLEKWVERWVFPRAALVLADREYYRAVAVRNGARPERAVATRVLADRVYAEARPDPALRERLGLADGPLLVYVGRLDADKLAGDLVECLLNVRAMFPRARLACAGSGALEAAMRERAAAGGAADGLVLLGTVDQATLATLLASADLVVAAHMGYTLVEAGLTGVPIVTYDYDWHGEVLRDGDTGYLAPLGDSAALAERVCHALAHPAEAAAVGARAREYLRREHSLERVIPLYRAAYERALRDHASGRP